MNSDPPESAWLASVLFGVVRSVELSTGRMDDDEAFRCAATRSTDAFRRLTTRAWMLANRPGGLLQELQGWRRTTPLIAACMTGLIGLVSWEVLATVAGHDRRINAVVALMAVLSFPTLSLLLWLLSLMWSGPTQGGGLARWTLALAIRAPGVRSPNALGLLRAVVETLGKARLLPWALGLINHLMWMGALLCILVGLLLSFSFRQYTLSWETTILTPDFFAQLVASSGWLPGHLGFPVPSVDAVSQASQSPDVQRTWAWWLIGCTVVYGLLPRIVASLVCWQVWRRRQSALRRVDEHDGYTQELLTRFARWDASAMQRGSVPGKPAVVRQVVAAVGFELPHDIGWPMQLLNAELGWWSRIEGTAQERRSTLDRLAQTQPCRVLVACNASATPDRGTARFIHAAVPGAAQGALLLLGDTATARWQNWLGSVQLGGLSVFTDAALAHAWLTGDGDA